MNNMLIGPELLEVQEYISQILSEEGRTMLHCYSHEAGLLAWEAIDKYYGEKCYNITLVDTILYLTLVEDESELRYQGALYAH